MEKNFGKKIPGKKILVRKIPEKIFGEQFLARNACKKILNTKFLKKKKSWAENYGKEKILEKNVLSQQS